jgi:LPXTG-site transpeptidase (sortase) family protein
MIFGHTSQERWEKNPYGTVFSNLPKLQAGDEIQLVYDGELHTYRVVETVVKRPKDVEAEFQKRQALDKDILTLM